ncbi:MAG: spore coat protein [Clostridia bacterium]|nr:spore coat protein [Clostridia bacterium]
MNLSQKETELIKDMKNTEKLCIEKYTKAAEEAYDPCLKQLCIHIAQIEQGHYDTLTKIENGESTASQSSPAGQSQQPIITQRYGAADNEEKKRDSFFANDLLTTEKHASHMYDTCVFEFKDENIRNTINHIQKEEQQHGKQLYDYMQQNSMY